MYGVYNTYRNKIYDNSTKAGSREMEIYYDTSSDIVSLEINCGM